MDRRAKRTMKPKKETKLLAGIISSHGGNLLAPGTLGPSGNFDTFIVSPITIKFTQLLTVVRKILDPLVENPKKLRRHESLRMSCWT